MSLKSKINFKKWNATKEGLEFLLTKEEVVKLLEEAGITWEQWSFSGYHLSRYNDSGNYERGNCRFLPALENWREHKFTEAQRLAAQEHGRTLFKYKTPESNKRGGERMLATKIRNGVTLSRKCEPECTCKRHQNGGHHNGGRKPKIQDLGLLVSL